MITGYVIESDFTNKAGLIEMRPHLGKFTFMRMHELGMKSYRGVNKGGTSAQILGVEKDRRSICNRDNMDFGSLRVRNEPCRRRQ